MKLRCLLVDDEPPAIKVLESHISNSNGLEIAGICKNAVEAMDILQEKKIDLIFLDIKMPKLLGTDFLKSLSNPPKVIFVTAYRDFAVEGYELDAIDYLVKPVSFERFLKAVARVKKVLGYEVTIHTEEYKSNPGAFIYLKVDKTMQKIIVNEILYLESWKDYVKLFLNTGKSFMAKQSISSMENLLSGHNFIRIHRSYLVSINKVTGYDNLTLKLNDKIIPIGRLYKQQVMEAIRSR
jgi:DNA-binding LytR/AlgR family response regulator